jgi:hypothetical protein
MARSGALLRTPLSAAFIRNSWVSASFPAKAPITRSPMYQQPYALFIFRMMAKSDTSRYMGSSGGT